MGSLGSCVKKINGFRFESFPSRKVTTNIQKLFGVGCYLYAMSRRGTIFTNSEMCGKICMCQTGSDYHAIKALLAFGLITKEEAMRHGEAKRKEEVAAARYRAAYQAASIFDEANIALTRSQKNKIERFKRDMKIDDLPYYMQKTAKLVTGGK